MGLKVHWDGFKLVNSLGLVQFKKKLRLPRTTFSNSDGKLILMGLYSIRSNMKWTSFSIALQEQKCHSLVMITYSLNVYENFVKVEGIN